MHLPANPSSVVKHPRHLLLAEAFEILTKSTDGSFQNGIASVEQNFTRFLCLATCFDTPQNHPKYKHIASRSLCKISPSQIQRLGYSCICSKINHFMLQMVRACCLVTLLSFISFHLLETVMDTTGKVEVPW